MPCRSLTGIQSRPTSLSGHLSFFYQGFRLGAWGCLSLDETLEPDIMGQLLRRTTSKSESCRTQVHQGRNTFSTKVSNQDNQPLAPRPGSVQWLTCMTGALLQYPSFHCCTVSCNSAKSEAGTEAMRNSSVLIQWLDRRATSTDPTTCASATGRTGYQSIKVISRDHSS